VCLVDADQEVVAPGTGSGRRATGGEHLRAGKTVTMEDSKNGSKAGRNHVQEMHKLTLKLDVQTGRPETHHSHRNRRWTTMSGARNPRNSGRNRAPRFDSLRQVAEGIEARRLVAAAQRGDDGDGRTSTRNSRWFSHREEKEEGDGGARRGSKARVCLRVGDGFMEREKWRRGEDHVSEGAGGRERGAHAVCQEEEQGTSPSTEKKRVKRYAPEVGCCRASWRESEKGHRGRREKARGGAAAC
jgi:hypothetical protein